jgi:hypothetical protein
MQLPHITQYGQLTLPATKTFIPVTAKTFIPVTKTLTGNRENNTNRRVWRIRTPLKCKRKKKPNGEPDKQDTLCRAMIKANVRPLPPSYSPTIMPLTFALFLQLAIIQQLHMATMDIKSACHNAPLLPDADWIVTTLETHIAASTQLRNIVSQTPCTYSPTPAAYST